MRDIEAPVVRLQHVGKVFDANGQAFQALDEVSFDIARGEMVAIMGPSGSGKSTLMNIIGLLDVPTSGSYLLDGEDVSELDRTRQAQVRNARIGFVFQNFNLLPRMTALANVALPLVYGRVSAREREERARAALAAVGLDTKAASLPNQLSGGQKQRVALARAIVFRPRLILMDEPLSALDKQLREHMQIEIRALHETLGATSIYVTHDQREALTLSHRIAILNKGRIAQYASPEDVYDRPADSFVADFIGEGTLVPVERAGPGAISLAGSVLQSPHPIPTGEDLKLVIRSEKLRLAPSSEDVNAFPARVRSIVFQGDSYLVLAETAHGLQLSLRLVTHAEGSHIPQPGEQIALQLHPDHTYVVAEPRS